MSSACDLSSTEKGHGYFLSCCLASRGQERYEIPLLHVYPLVLGDFPSAYITEVQELHVVNAPLLLPQATRVITSHDVWWSELLEILLFSG
jgi:hypothetical protein